MTLWNVATGRECDATPLTNVVRPTRLVACLNVWNDVNALRQTMPTWARLVSHIIAVDGSYGTLGSQLSTDGTRDYLKAYKNLTLIDAPGLTQCEKRTRYLRACVPGDYLFIIDADEALIGGESLQTSLPFCDVGWVRIQSTMYQRIYGQPRIIRWRQNLEYRGRHHWMYEGERLFCTHQYGGTGYMHRPINVTLYNKRQLGRSRARIAEKKTSHHVQLSTERSIHAMPQSKMSDAAIGAREALHILNYAYRDDGLAPSRLHTAINRTTPHSSVFVKVRPGPFSAPEQYLAVRHAGQLRAALEQADIVHYHGVISQSRGARAGAKIVLHHHGTLFRRNAEAYMKDARRLNALVLLSNLELFSWTGGGEAYFLPNTVPVGRYLELRTVHKKLWQGSGLFRIAHSPSQPQRKGTDVFLKVCAKLQARGITIQPVILHDLAHRDVLAQKATCHAMFDSFWLGMQCSGLEAAAMHMPVIAGDDTVAQRYKEHYGAIPYTFANDENTLEDAIYRLVSDYHFYLSEASRVFTHVRDHHDEAAVALRYLDLLDQKFHWRSQPLMAPPHRFPAQRAVARR